MNFLTFIRSGTGRRTMETSNGAVWTRSEVRCWTNGPTAAASVNGKPQSYVRKPCTRNATSTPSVPVCWTKGGATCEHDVTHRCDVIGPPLRGSYVNHMMKIIVLLVTQPSSVKMRRHSHRPLYKHRVGDPCRPPVTYELNE